MEAMEAKLEVGDPNVWEEYLIGKVVEFNDTAYENCYCHHRYKKQLKCLRRGIPFFYSKNV
jgi:hypothetical protein